MYRIEKTRLPELLQSIAAKQDLFVPIKEDQTCMFGLYSEGVTADMETLQTDVSPKGLFFPQSEALYNVKNQEGNLTITAEELVNRNFVVFGLKACDYQGIEVLDRVFLSEPFDSYYAARREHSLLITAACHRPVETCFCSCFEIDPTNPTGDVSTWQSGEFLYWQPGSEKGKKLTEDVVSEGLLSETDASEVEEEKEKIKAILERLPYRDLSLEKWGGDVLEERFDSPLWEELYKPCLACGTCTFVCPTCQCYDIKDYNTGKEVIRYRCWDSCMYSDFTMMAHGNNRTSQMQRFRQRYMHKLVYYPANYDGEYSCVGCGRCVNKCPAHLNIVKVIKAFEREGTDV